MNMECTFFVSVKLSSSKGSKMLTVLQFFVTFYLLGAIFAQHTPHFKPGHRVIVELFEWTFQDIAKECVFLGQQGFGGVQVAPVQEHAIIKGRPWWERYQPVSYKIFTRSGGEKEFQEMVKACNESGIRIYVDVILNHMAAPSSFNTTDIVEGIGGSVANPNLKEYPGVPFTSADFHKDCDIEEGFYKTDAHGIRNCKMVSLPDLDHYKTNVKQHQVAFLNRLVEFGVAGFRIDKAKHMWPIDCRDIYAQVNDLNTDFDFPENARPFFYQEVVDMGSEAISKIEYAGYGVVTEFVASYILANVLKGGAPLTDLKLWGDKMGLLQSKDALVFVDNHDTQRGTGAGGETILNYKNRKLYTMANAFLLSHPYGHKRIMSSFAFTNSDQGPPTNKDDTIRSPFCEDSVEDDCKDDDNNQKDEYGHKQEQHCRNESGWVCEHRWPSIVNMVKMVNIVKDEPITNFGSIAPNHIYFCRGGKAFIALNNDPVEKFNKTINTCLQEGVYCDVISGGLRSGVGDRKCTGLEIIVANDKTARIIIPEDDEYGVIVIHTESKLQ
ncbi:Amy-d family protein [Megaselia abdita]